MTPSARPGQFQEAIRYFRNKVPMTEPEFRKLWNEDHDRAFMVSGVTQLRVVQEFMDALDRAISKGTTLDEFKADMETRANETWGAAAGTRLEVMFRTNVQSAYNRGRYEQAMEPDVMELRPFWEYLAIDDVPRLCPLCESCKGTVLSAGDSWWTEHYPPLHHLCRCRVRTLSTAEATKKGLTKEPSKLQPTGTFGSTPDADLFQPNLTDMDPELRAAFLRNEKRVRPR